MDGTVGILNVGAGDTKLSFDPNNPADRIRAARIVKDMLRRGYALLVEVERNGVKKFERAYDFQEDTCEYVIADFDPLVAQAVDDQDKQAAEAPAVEVIDPASTAETPISGRKRPNSRRGRTKRIPAESTRAVAVARSAGG